MSGAFSLHDAPGEPTPELLDLSMALIQAARRATLPILRDRRAPEWVHFWPGEHYRLLAGTVEHMRPARVLEIGTYQGLSALAMCGALPPGSQVTTVDVEPWENVYGTYLRAADFDGPKLRRVTCDLGNRAVAWEYRDLIREADLILIDASHDGELERRLLANFDEVGLKDGALLVLDDIRMWAMVPVWRSIVQPKLDLTSFGHWSGTGLVLWKSRADQAGRRHAE